MFKKMFKKKRLELKKVNKPKKEPRLCIYVGHPSSKFVELVEKKDN